MAAYRKFLARVLVGFNHVARFITASCERLKNFA
jgi:hypothetical protein